MALLDGQGQPLPSSLPNDRNKGGDHLARAVAQMDAAGMFPKIEARFEELADALEPAAGMMNALLIGKAGLNLGSPDGKQLVTMCVEFSFNALMLWKREKEKHLDKAVDVVENGGTEVEPEERT